MYTSAETIRLATALLYPVLPESTAKIWEQLGMTTTPESLRLDSLKWGQLPAGQKIEAMFDLLRGYGYRVVDSKTFAYKGAEFGDYLFVAD